jgi:hypothetical protein
MDPAFPDIVGDWAASQVGDRAKVWTVSRSADGKLEERLDDSFIAQLEQAESVEDMVDVILAAAARQDIDRSRAW